MSSRLGGSLAGERNRNAAYALAELLSYAPLSRRLAEEGMDMAYFAPTSPIHRGSSMTTRSMLPTSGLNFGSVTPKTGPLRAGERRRKRGH